jgi:hypothetical protein
VRKRSAETLLAQFTSRDNAVSIVGDITELSVSRTPGWFTAEVIRLAVSFWVRSELAAPFRALGYAGVGLGVYFGAYAVCLVASGLPWFPWHRTHEWGFSLRLWAMVFVSNFLTGAILATRLTPARTRAIAWLMLLWVTAALIWPLFALRLYPWSWWPSAIHMPWRFVLAVALPPLLYVAPLIIGVLTSRKLFGVHRQMHF